MSQQAPPLAVDDPINARILAVSEDRVAGFVERPFQHIADLAELELDVVIDRVRAMLDAGVIRRVRQTMLTTSLAPGALVAWEVSAEKLNHAFDWMFQQDPFSGHVVVRSADPASPGSQYKLWTTLKVPQGYDMDKHCRLLMQHTGAAGYRLMPAKKLFSLGVGHIRRRTLEPGSRTDEPGKVIDTDIVQLNDREWQVLAALKREFDCDEIVAEPWRKRAEEAGVEYDEFLSVARQLNERGVVGRFSTFLEHVKAVAGQQRVTRFNALFHWQVPPGREMEAGQEVGRHHVMTHAYWREGGPEFRNVNIMGVAHGLDKDLLLAHKKAIDEHLAEAGIDVGYTNVFWGGRSEIKPSEILPAAYEAWCQDQGINPAVMHAEN
ncbi:Lrp/AsnC family transcriptional regulator [Phycisphaerales bacterium AB-hyl4]|uniref:Lrp/AsnC family transcriptional regulator n=1 Tax=Natronomicrosphaera hydrolytica TaxID=3242702 RepID=A0ABV4U7X2_9BACT